MIKHDTDIKKNNNRKREIRIKRKMKEVTKSNKEINLKLKKKWMSA